jgi:hypothetical protein
VAKVKFNVKGVEKRSGDLDPIPKGVYDAEIESCTVNKPEGKDERIEVVYVITGPEQKGRKLFEYINLESEEGAWRVRQFLEAVGLVTDKKETGSFEPEKLVGTSVKVRVTHQADKRAGHEGEISSRAGAVWAPGSDEDEDAEDLDEDADEPDDDDDDDEVDLDELDRKELKALIKEQELEIKVSKSMSDQDIRDAIAEALGEEDEDEPDDEDDEDDEDDDEVDLDELDRVELKKLIKDQELGISVKKSMSDDDVRKAIAEALSDDDDDEDEDDDEEQDYNDLSVEDLRATCKERGLSGKGSKKVLVKRLEKDDEASKDGKDPF